MSYVDILLDLVDKGWRKLSAYVDRLAGDSSNKKTTGTNTYRDQNGVYQPISGKVSKWRRLKRIMLKAVIWIVIFLAICLAIKVAFDVIVALLLIIALLMILAVIRHKR